MGVSYGGCPISLDLIIDAIKSERCLPFLGAGASATYSHNGVKVLGIPLGGRLGEIIADTCEYPKDLTYDLPTVAEYHVYHNNGHREELERLLYDQVKDIHMSDLAPQRRWDGWGEDRGPR